MKKTITKLLIQTVLKYSILLLIAILLFVYAVWVAYQDYTFWNLSFLFSILGFVFLALFIYLFFFGALSNFKAFLNRVSDTNLQNLQDEKEAAWKKMASQVAKAIEELITPMKLSGQYLQTTLQKPTLNAPGIANKLADALLVQVDLLANIAREFSVFSQIGNPILTHVNLEEAIESVIKCKFPDELHTVTFVKEAGDYSLQADLTHINLLFKILLGYANHTNLPSGVILQTRILLSDSPGEILTTFHYNLPLVSQNSENSLFEPDFSHNANGLKVGLYNCRLIVEKARGSIELDSLNTNGTKIHIRFPKTAK